jgi:hypothetical protein
MFPFLFVFFLSLLVDPYFISIHNTLVTTQSDIELNVFFPRIAYSRVLCNSYKSRDSLPKFVTECTISY